MGLRLVDDDLDMSFNIPLAPDERQALSVQLQRACGDTERLQFEVRLCQQIRELIDADLRPPTARQIAFALSIAKTLDIALPGEALRHKGAMFDFLNRHASAFKSRSGSGGGNGAK